MNETDTPKKSPASTIIITAIAIIFIIGLAFAYYYFTVANPTVAEPTPESTESVATNSSPQEVLPQETTQPVTEPSTTVIYYTVPLTEDMQEQQGSCTMSSVAEPYRQDAWKCQVAKTTYDPCFSTDQADRVVCQPNPTDSENIFAIKLTSPLPEPTIPQTTQSNWAWFVQLEDGSLCSPYTAKRPLVDGEAAFYGSAIKDGKRFVLIGDLNNSAKMWTATKKNLIKSGTTWVTESTETVNIQAVWK